jgi:hypothetical protein
VVIPRVKCLTKGQHHVPTHAGRCQVSARMLVPLLGVGVEYATDAALPIAVAGVSHLPVAQQVVVGTTKCPQGRPSPWRGLPAFAAWQHVTPLS